MTSKELIFQLELRPHPEGGYFRETYRSGQVLHLPAGKSRNVSTAIYYLLEDDDKSRLHRIQSDELWFFHQGEPLEVVFINEAGEAGTILLGNNVNHGEVPQAMIPAKLWFGSRVRSSSGYSLVSCTVAPGFDFADFEMAEKETLLREFPHLEELIQQFT